MRSCLLFPDSQTTYACDSTKPPTYERRSAFEEYRYDALGRRVLVRTRSEFACTQYCLNTLRRTVWDGDQVLYEISAPGGSSATAAQMEADTGLAVPFFLNQQHTAVAGFFPYGRVMYEHGGGIDAPLGVVRMEYSTELHDPQVIVPHSDWRGTYDRGTTIAGSCLVYSSNGKQLAPPPDSTPSNPDQYGGVAGGGTYGGTKEHCIDVDWPAAYTWSARQYRRGYAGPDSWMGSLIFESRDASGLYYRRNRYYDSETGRFTQEDPIGLAGGVNVYGFANGDPVTFSDSYGLCPPADANVNDCPKGRLGDAWRALSAAGPEGQEVIDIVVSRGARVVLANSLSTICGSRRACTSANHDQITLRSSLQAGAMAVALGHEAGGHLSETPATTVEEASQNEWRAWDLQTIVYDHLSGSRRREAEREFKTEIDYFKAHPAEVMNQFRTEAKNRCPSCP